MISGYWHFCYIWFYIGRNASRKVPRLFRGSGLCGFWLAHAGALFSYSASFSIFSLVDENDLIYSIELTNICS